MELNKSLRKNKFSISSGDIFEVKLENSDKRFFQFLYKDDNYMSGHVIRAFVYTLAGNVELNINDLSSCQVDFITHTRVFEGLKDELWAKIGNLPLEQDFEPPIFRQTNDVYSMVKKSHNWFIWQYNPENRKYIGNLTEKYEKLPFSSILPPIAIIEWLNTGWHGFMRPE